MTAEEIRRHNEAVKKLQIDSFGELCRVIGNQLLLTKGLLIGLMFCYMITFTFFPGLMDATYLKWMDKDIKANEKTWF